MKHNQSKEIVTDIAATMPSSVIIISKLLAQQFLQRASTTPTFHTGRLSQFMTFSFLTHKTHDHY